MQSASTVFHLLGALRRAIGQVILWFFLLLIVGALIVEGIGYFAAGQHFELLTHIAAGAVGLTLGYAAALTVLVGEVIRFFVASVRTAERDLKGEVTAGAKIMDTVVQGIEHLEKRM